MMRVCLLVVIGFVLTGCALGEGPTPTPPPPITLPAPPPLLLEGSCDEAAGLDNWLQTTVYLVSEFQTAVNSAATQQRGELYDTVLNMARIRDAANNTVAPECAVPVHIMMVETMKTTVDNLQAYVNGDRDSLGNAIPSAISQLDQITAGQNELIARLETLYRSRAATAQPQ